jgi:hypothetical protein
MRVLHDLFSLSLTWRIITDFQDEPYRLAWFSGDKLKHIGQFSDTCRIVSFARLYSARQIA